jgi:hypothetical protein
MGIVWISIGAHDEANRFKAVASLGIMGTVFRVCCRRLETTTFRFSIRTMPPTPDAHDAPASHASILQTRRALIQIRLLTTEIPNCY